MSPTYWTWVRAEASLIKSDGCSKVADIHKDCCYEHDLAYHYGRDPRASYAIKSWSLAAKISRSEADARFRKCNQELSSLGKASPLAGWRWLGLRVGGWLAWRNHRKVRP